LYPRSKRPPRPPENERSLVEWLAGREETAALLGDDAAVFGARGPHVVTVDSQIEGVHFQERLDPAIVARRLLAVNVSDLAAMGARPTHAFLALSTPAGFEHRRFFDALLRESRRAGLVLAGGDLARAPVVTASLTVVGSPWPGSRRFLRRRDARASDAIYLGGSVGESALGRELLRRGAPADGRRGAALPEGLGIPRGLVPAARRAIDRHLRPRPQLELGAWLSKQKRGAAIDVSDGVARDLHRICAASGVGAVIDASRLPRSPRFAELAAALGLDAESVALGGGEDYVLLFTLDPRVVVPRSFAARRIGSITSGDEVVLEGAFEAGGGPRRPLPDLGWDHLSARA
jgi:thiamine-monophosphate kinase